MKFSDNYLLDTKVYIVISNCGNILKCFGNKQNAYIFATRECFEYIEENDNNKHILEDIYNVDADEYNDFTKKLELIHKNWVNLIKSDMDYYSIVHVEEHQLNTEDCFV